MDKNKIIVFIHILASDKVRRCSRQRVNRRNVRDLDFSTVFDVIKLAAVICKSGYAKRAVLRILCNANYAPSGRRNCRGGQQPDSVLRWKNTEGRADRDSTSFTVVAANSPLFQNAVRQHNRKRVVCRHRAIHINHNLGGAYGRANPSAQANCSTGWVADLDDHAGTQHHARVDAYRKADRFCLISVRVKKPLPKSVGLALACTSEGVNILSDYAVFID